MASRAFIDTVAIIPRKRLDARVFARLRELQRRALIIEEFVFLDRRGKERRGFRIFIHQPKVKTLRYLELLERLGYFTVYAVHVAVDLLTRGRDRAASLAKFLNLHLRQTWRTPQDRVEHVNTVYWKQDAKAPRNVAIYADRNSKTGLGHCCHIEMRFTKKGACDRAGLSDLHSLRKGLDAHALLNRQTKVMKVEDQKLRRSFDKLARDYFSRTRRKHALVWVKGGYVPLTINLLSGKIEELYSRSLWGRSLRDVDTQTIWDTKSERAEAVKRSLVEVPWNQITSALTWHAWR